MKLNPAYNNQLKEVRDMKRKTDFSGLSSKVNVIYAQTWKLPKTINDLWVNIKDFTDPSEWEIIWWQKCWYVYEVKWNKFKFSTCLESWETNKLEVWNY